MVIKMDKSEDFIKSGKKLISEYDGANLKDDVDNLLREVVGDYKNDKKTKKNLNEEDQNDEEVLLLWKLI